MSDRRTFLTAAAGTVLAAAVRGADAPKLHVATNFYPWHTFYARRKQNFFADLDASLAAVARSGLDGFEGNGGSPDEVRKVAPLLKKHHLEMRSMYVNSKLHDKDAAASIKQVLAVADAARELGCRIVVTNPTPLQWGGNLGKTDAQLTFQAARLDELGAGLRAKGMTLAYHNHDVELKHAAREFHHMMLGTDPKHVSLCLDVHWIFRGSDDSQVALFDVVKLYGKRVAELHLRQSANGVWTEVFGEGDIDHPRLVRALAAQGVKPHLVLEQAVEAKSPDTVDAVEAHRRGLEYVRKTFVALAG
ncbi:MAG: sugar phosphate isomerase/epimerase [Gemmataceae bacterium]